MDAFAFLPDATFGRGAATAVARRGAVRAGPRTSVGRVAPPTDGFGFLDDEWAAFGMASGGMSPARRRATPATQKSECGCGGGCGGKTTGLSFLDSGSSQVPADVWNNTEAQGKCGCGGQCMPGSGCGCAACASPARGTRGSAQSIIAYRARGPYDSGGSPTSGPKCPGCLSFSTGTAPFECKIVYNTNPTEVVRETCDGDCPERGQCPTGTAACPLGLNVRGRTRRIAGVSAHSCVGLSGNRQQCTATVFGYYDCWSVCCYSDMNGGGGGGGGGPRNIACYRDECEHRLEGDWITTSVFGYGSAAGETETRCKERLGELCDERRKECPPRLADPFCGAFGRMIYAKTDPQVTPPQFDTNEEGNMVHTVRCGMFCIAFCCYPALGRVH